jgi:O-antigen/teichoic acid export membrane protein
MAAALAVHSLVAHLLPPAEVGRFFLLYSIVVVARTLGGLGVGRTLVRTLGQVEPAAGQSSARRTLEGAFVLVTGGGLAVATLLATAPGAALLGALGAASTPRERALVALWALALVFEAIGAEAFRGLRRIGHAVVFNGLLSSCILIAFLLAWRSRGVDNETLLNEVLALAALAAGLTGAIAIARLVPWMRGTGLRTSGTVVLDLLRPSAPILISTLIAMLLDQIGLWMLSAWSQDAAQLALYGTAQRLARVVSVPLVVANVVLPPIMARLHAEGDRSTLTATLRLSATVTALPAVLAAALLVGAGPIVMRLVFGPYYVQAAPVAGLLAAGHLIGVASGSCGLLLLMSGEERAHLAINGLALGALAGGGAMLGTSIDAWSLARVTLVVTALQQLTFLITARRRTGVWTGASWSPRRVRDGWRRLEAP